jgi:hypothetical protein
VPGSKGCRLDHGLLKWESYFGETAKLVQFAYRPLRRQAKQIGARH